MMPEPSVPKPRRPTDSHGESEGVGVDREWSYHYRGKRGADVTFDGNVILVDGEAGERLRTELGAVLRDLLEWAHDKRSQSQDGEGI